MRIELFEDLRFVDFEVGNICGDPLHIKFPKRLASDTGDFVDRFIWSMDLVDCLLEPLGERKLSIKLRGLILGNEKFEMLILWALNMKFVPLAILLAKAEVGHVCPEPAGVRVIGIGMELEREVSSHGRS